MKIERKPRNIDPYLEDYKVLIRYSKKYATLGCHIWDMAQHDYR